MDIRNCNVCGAIFNNVWGRGICDKCFLEEEDLFHTVTKFIRSQRHRKSTLEKIVEETNVSEDLILKWVKIGRLKPIFFEHLEYSCKICDNPINSGEICSDCISKLKELLQITDTKGNATHQTHATYHVNDDE